MPGVMADAIAKFAVICVELTTFTPLVVMPAGVFTVVPDVKLVPVNVTGTLVPATPVFGLMDDNVGCPAGGLTVNATELLVPPMVAMDRL